MIKKHLDLNIVQKLKLEKKIGKVNCFYKEAYYCDCGLLKSCFYTFCGMYQVYP